MTVHVAVLGIDGSGKSTLTASLAAVLAAEWGLVAGSAVGDEFWVRGPLQDFCAPRFNPRGDVAAVRMERFFRRSAKLVVNSKSLYPATKVFQMLLQDNAAVKIAKRYGVDVMVSDGNLMLSGAGRAFNYRGPIADAATSEDVDLAFTHLFENHPLPKESRARLPDLRMAEILAAIARFTKMEGIWIPDHVLFLDVEPQVALDRIAGRGARIDRHENLRDMEAARTGYLRVLDVIRKRNGDGAVHVIDAGNMTQGEMLAAALEELRAALRERDQASRAGALHEGGEDVKRQALSLAYVRYVLGHLLDGASSEVMFPLSTEGRTFLKEGYSAQVMRIIYEEPARTGPVASPFYRYPLHRAVHDRLPILQKHIAEEVVRRLESAERVWIFTGPSGVAYDVLSPLEKLPVESRKKVSVTAADLDPDGTLGQELTSRASLSGITLEFMRGDLTSDEFRAGCADKGPFDIALFVGLSSWLPKAPTLRHLRWLRSNLAAGGVVVSDCFVPRGYAVGGAVMGYKASYYTPAVYRSLLDYCGFDGMTARVESGANGINHVVLARPR